MHKHKTRVVSDRYNEWKESMGSYGMMGGMDDNVIPVDLYGKRVFPNKNDPNNLKNAGEDIQEYYDLRSDFGLKEGE